MTIKYTRHSVFQAICDTHQYMVVEKVREILSVLKQESHNFDMKRLNLKKLKYMEDREL